MKMKMKKLLLAIFLGLLSSVHASPLNTALPAEDDLQEVEMDGYILHHARLTTDSPKKNTTAQASQPPSFESSTEGSGDTLWLKSATTAPSLASLTEGSGDSTTSGFESTTTAPSFFESTTEAIRATSWLESATTAPSFVSSTTETSVDATTSWFESRGAESTTTAPSFTPSTTEGSGNSVTSWLESTTVPSFFESTTETSVDSTTSWFESTTTAQNVSESTPEGSGATSWLESTTTAPSFTPSTTEGSGDSTTSGFESTTTAPSFVSSTTDSTTSWFESRGAESTTTAPNVSESTPEGSGATSWPVESSGEEPTAVSVSLPPNPDDSTSDSSTVQPGVSTSTMPNEANGSQSEPEVEAKEAAQSRMVEKLEELANPASNEHKGHSTPDWIIILGFLVGLAALVLLCVAIATKDKWNGPQQVLKDETKTNSRNQTRELEMQTFLHREEPQENGREAEYTVIPLEDLPEKFSSH